MRYAILMLATSRKAKGSGAVDQVASAMYLISNI